MKFHKKTHFIQIQNLNRKKAKRINKNKFFILMLQSRLMLKLTIKSLNRLRPMTMYQQMLRLKKWTKKSFDEIFSPVI